MSLNGNNRSASATKNNESLVSLKNKQRGLAEKAGGSYDELEPLSCNTITNNDHTANINEATGEEIPYVNIPSPTNAQMEELNTKELAQKVSSELKRYSIPQAVFAQRVLCRSQGTLSDLLRNPKPWSKLKSGRETFRRMYKWIQEPESQRMNALRLAGKNIYFLRNLLFFNL
jgi:hypothetical protein